MTSKRNEKATSMFLAILLIFLIGLCFNNETKIPYSTFYVISTANLEHGNFNAFRLVNRLLRNGFAVYLVMEQAESASFSLEPGDFLVSTACNLDYSFAAKILRDYLEDQSRHLNVTVKETSLDLEVKVSRLNKPKVAVYYGEGTTGNSIEQIRVLEKAEFELKLLTSSELKNWRYYDFNAVMFPGGGPYEDYLTEEDISSLKGFVLNGGGYVGICGGSVLGASIGLLNVKLMKGILYPQFPEYADFRGPVKLKIFQNNPLTSGYSGFLNCVYFRGPFFSDVENDVKIAAVFDSLTSETEIYFPEIAKAYNFSINTDSLNRCFGTPAVVFGSYGKGKVVLSSVHPEILDDSQRFFINMAFFALSGEEEIINRFSTTKSDSNHQANQCVKIGTSNLSFILSEAKFMIQALQNRSKEALRLILDFVEINQKIVGVTGDYLNLFLEDVDLRSTNILTKLESFEGEYCLLENVKECLSQLPHTLVLKKRLLLDTISAQRKIEDIIASILGGEALNFYLMDNVIPNVSNLVGVLRNISSSFNENCTLENDTVIKLYLTESLIVNEIKKSVAFFLLETSFQINCLIVKLDFLRKILEVNNFYSCFSPSI